MATEKWMEIGTALVATGSPAFKLDAGNSMLSYAFAAILVLCCWEAQLCSKRKVLALEEEILELKRRLEEEKAAKIRADQLAQDAQRTRAALEDETTCLTERGATNAKELHILRVLVRVHVTKHGSCFHIKPNCGKSHVEPREITCADQAVREGRRLCKTCEKEVETKIVSPGLIGKREE